MPKRNQDLQKIENKGEIILYDAGEAVRLNVKLENDTVWLTIEQMSLLFLKKGSLTPRNQ